MQTKTCLFAGIKELKRKNVTAFSKHIGRAYHISQRYQYKWASQVSQSVLNETHKFKEQLTEFKCKSDEMFDCTDKDDLGMTSFLAHTIDNSNVIFANFHSISLISKSLFCFLFKLEVQIDVPNKIWFSRLFNC
jgi:hypothetical protein